MTLPTIPSEFPCPAGDIISLPTKKELVDALNKIAQIPSKLKVYMVELGDELTAEVRETIEGIIKDIETLMDSIANILSPYWKKGTIRNWQKEAKDAITELLEELHIYVPVKIMDLIGKLIPVTMSVTIMGIDIDLLKFITKEEQERIKKQIEDDIDSFYILVPECYRTFDGTFGLKVNEWKAKVTFSYLKSEIMDWINNYYFKIFEKLISVFKTVWDALSLPSLPTPFVFDLEGLLNGMIADARSKFKDSPEKMREYMLKQIEGISIAGFDLMTIIGGKIDETVTSVEDQINEFIVDLRDFKINWKKKLLFDWVKIIKSFLDAIGLGAIFDFVALTFCDFLKIIGFPMKIDITVPSTV